MTAHSRTLDLIQKRIAEAEALIERTQDYVAAHQAAGQIEVLEEVRSALLSGGEQA
jgi:hypothetical protein